MFSIIQEHTEGAEEKKIRTIWKEGEVFRLKNPDLSKVAIFSFSDFWIWYSIWPINCEEVQYYSEYSEEKQLKCECFLWFSFPSRNHNIINIHNMIWFRVIDLPMEQLPQNLYTL